VRGHRPERGRWCKASDDVACPPPEAAWPKPAWVSRIFRYSTYLSTLPRTAPSPPDGGMGGGPEWRPGRLLKGRASRPACCLGRKNRVSNRPGALNSKGRGR
jgi:hypothetical protein